jgi:hypothetical protein
MIDEKPDDPTPHPAQLSLPRCYRFRRHGYLWSGRKGVRKPYLPVTTAFGRETAYQYLRHAKLE